MKKVLVCSNILQYCYLRYKLLAGQTMFSGMM